MLQSRLLENITQARRYSDSENLRSERNRILGRLNGLSTETIRVSFNRLCASYGKLADIESARLFISYKRHADPDQRLAVNHQDIV
jgi:hypothetical protein